MIVLKTPEEIEIMAEAGQKLGRVLHALRVLVRVGVTTKYLDEASHALIKEEGAEPAFLNYRPPGSRKGYPFTLCASLNETVVHGLPSDYALKDGDLVKLDLGLKLKGFYVDSAITVGIGNISREAKKLMAITEEALAKGIKEARVGKTTGDIGYVIESCAKKNKFSIVESLTGHGIGRGLHEDPYVLNFGKPGSGEELRVGMVIAIEPMVAMGSGASQQLRDESFITKDGSLAAHFEHTVAITAKGPRILTKV
jgi:methionyl aminopeptidase